jgi:hypothetical protein
MMAIDSAMIVIGFEAWFESWSRHAFSRRVAPLKGQLGVNVPRPNGSRKVQGPEGADPILDPQEIQLLPMFTRRTPGGAFRGRFAFHSPIVVYSLKR